MQEATFNAIARDYNDYRTTNVSNTYYGGSAKLPLDRTFSTQPGRS